MSTYWIGDTAYADDAPELQDALAAIYASDMRPRCLCVPNGVPMYISHFSKYVVKRMPDTGHLHAPECDSFDVVEAEPDRARHGRDAIERMADGRLKVRLGFPLTRYEGKSVPHGVGSRAADLVARRPGGLSLGALLRLLWHEAGFNTWTPKMQGKRHWGLVRHFLLRTATDIDAKGGRLAELLLIPEPFHLQTKDAIAARLAQQLAQLDSSRKGVHPMRVLIGELKNLEDSPTGGRALIKHLPTVTLHLDEDLMTRIKRHFGAALATVQAGAGAHLIMTCTVRRADDRYVVPAATLMTVNSHWIPVANRFERAVADALIATDRSFIKVLRYGAPDRDADASFVLRDTGEHPVAMNVVVDSRDSGATAASEAQSSDRADAVWVWRAGQMLDMPPLPPVARLHRTAGTAPRPTLGAEPRAPNTPPAT